MNKSDYLSIGNQILNAENYNSAKDIFTECLILDLQDVKTIFLLAETEIYLGNYHKALYLMLEAQKINDDEQVRKQINDIRLYIVNNEIKEKLLTVSFIVKNEEQTLPRALKSVGYVADEIIVVDTGSTDNTVAIAESMGAKIYHFDWINDYAAARNISIKYATSKWVLYLDADEELTADSKRLISELLKKASPDTGGFLCEINSQYYKQDNTLGVHSGNYPRCFRNIGYPLLHFFGKVHEQISPSLSERDYEIVKSPLVIEHHGYAISQQEMFEKIQKHLKTLREDIEQNPYNGYSWYHLGNTLYQMKRYAECKEILENSLKCGNLSKLLSANTALLLSRVHEHLGDLNKAMEMAHKSISYVDNYKHALIRKAELLNMAGMNNRFTKI
jgi:glycosyltransferase involved in cell wall biosynthesis